MFEVAMKIFKAVRGAMVEVVMFLLAALLLTGLFTGLGAGQAGQAGGALGIVGAVGVLAYAVHQRKKQKNAGGLQRGTDVQASTNGGKE